MREADHADYAPDLYDGSTLPDLNESVAYAEHVSFPEDYPPWLAAAGELPSDIVFGGFSLGACPQWA